MKSGDVVIRRKAGTRICIWGIVWDDGVFPEHWTPAVITEVVETTGRIVAETGGTIHQFDVQPGPITSSPD